MAGQFILWEKDYLVVIDKSPLINLLSSAFRCNITGILLEMDRILRPGGHVYVRDVAAVVKQVQVIAEAMGWRTALGDTEEGPYSSRRQMRCEKPLRRR